MPKSENQKQKLLYLQKILMEETDENHPISVPKIIEKLDAYDIKAERKSIYDDIKVLTAWGMDIENRRSKPSGFYLASREFELAEVKMLVDLVQTSKFITEKKSNALIKKLESLVSHTQAKELQREVVVANRVKTDNENIYYNIDELHHAIADNKKITFEYYNWNIDGTKHLRHGGELYRVSPWKLTWDDENYYLIAFDDKDKKVKYYRVDKMQHISTLEEIRDGRKVFEKMDMARFARKTFGMYDGEERTITLTMPKEMVSVVYDRFGLDTSIRPEGDERIRFHADVAVSNQFYGWISSLGKGIRIESPKDIREEYIEYLQSLIDSQQ
ncbi:helix-turn-helix transcriptional regulator [Eubacterium oxidoreducens]|uniref:Predicted DNA-binding transcriptional regulator YafY, contains an HTH and WYL domains n=1 Tax=Eubacterium oxidoreducens TaxID=1732 RepID=A0A1G6CAF7_EUBOX|nr:WYL domain-containing protein [Eubacterium oxidoreducens]SDB29845.1 Predicted DNA-binding transcriptional regulator YafY, contains an HTH and WYL domains [Eubacterium oxidoreducens]